MLIFYIPLRRTWVTPIMSLVLHKIAYPNGILPLLQTSETGRLNFRAFPRLFDM